MTIINEWLVQYLLNIAAASVERGARKKKAFLSSFTVFFIVCLKTRKIFFLINSVLINLPRWHFAIQVGSNFECLNKTLHRLNTDMCT